MLLSYLRLNGKDGYPCRPFGNKFLKRVETTKRKPMLLFLLLGLLLLRLAQRTFLDVLLNAPPRWSEGVSPAVGATPTDA
jgi:hypothetical protein